MEQFVVIMGTALGLSMDAFAVALASSVTLGTVTRRQVFRFGFHFGLFQAMMPVLGWLAGRQVRGYVDAWDHWVAFGLLALVGGKAIYEAFQEEAAEAAPNDPTRGMSLVTLSVATSIDAFAVGLSFAMSEVTIWYPSVIIGVVTATLTSLGMLMGSRLGSRFGRRMEVVGGLILIGIGINILVHHGA